MEKAREIRVKADEEFAIEKVQKYVANYSFPNVDIKHRPNSSSKRSKPLTVYTRRKERVQKLLRRCAHFLVNSLYIKSLLICLVSLLALR